MNIPSYMMNIGERKSAPSGVAPSYALGRQIAGDFGKAIESVAATNARAQKLEKVDALIQAYNNPRSEIFSGMVGGQRMLKLGRLLMPYDMELANKYIDAARADESKEAESEREIRELRVAGQIKREQEAAKPVVISAADSEKAINARAALSQQVKSGKITPDFARRKFEMDYPYSKFGVSFGVGDEDITAQAGYGISPTAAPGYDVASATTKEKISQEKLATRKASADLVPAEFDASQYEQDSAGYFSGIPKQLQTFTDALEKDYRLSTRELRSLMSDADYTYKQLSDKTNGFKENISGANAVAAIFRFMKSLDPGSTVRESEYAAAKGAAGWWDKTMSSFLKLSRGENLPVEIVEQMADIAIESKQKYQDAIDNIAAEAAAKSSSRSVNPVYVMGRDAENYMMSGNKTPGVATIPPGARKK